MKLTARLIEKKISKKDRVAEIAAYMDGQIPAVPDILEIEGKFYSLTGTYPLTYKEGIFQKATICQR